MNDAELLRGVDELKATMVSVATGGPKIGEVNGKFAQLHDDLAEEFERRGVSNPLPYRDLWIWHGRWSDGSLASWQSRRVFVDGLFAPIVRLCKSGGVSEVEPTGWDRVDRAIQESRTRLQSAKSEEQFQAVGLICRETLISLAQAVFDAESHPILDEVAVSKTDARRMLEAFIAVELAGNSQEDVRKHVKAALGLAVNLQHKRTATFREAAICVEATISVLNVVAIISGRRVF